MSLRFAKFTSKNTSRRSDGGGAGPAAFGDSSKCSSAGDAASLKREPYLFDDAARTPKKQLSSDQEAVCGAHHRELHHTPAPRNNLVDERRRLSKHTNQSETRSHHKG